jgi:hypothetical protein
MRKILAGSVAAAALGTVLMVASALPASAQVARPQLAAGVSGNNDMLTLVQGRESRGTSRDARSNEGVSGRSSARSGSRSGGDSRWSGGSRWSDSRWSNRSRWSNNRYRRHNNFGYGFAAGALIGGAYAAQPYYAEPYTYADDDAVAYCMSRFRSYDPESGTYLGNDGFRHPCP